MYFSAHSDDDWSDEDFNQSLIQEVFDREQYASCSDSDDEVLARLLPNKSDAETPLDSDNEPLMLIQKRLKDESAEHDQRVQTHEAESRLTNLLASNGLQKWPVSADGDCLLSAVSLQVPELGFSADQLREKVCEHISLYSAHYAPFLSHSCMESDSMHSAIETAKRKTQVHVPSQWDTVIRLARKKKPYLVNLLRFSDFYDYKSLGDSLLSGASRLDRHGQKVNFRRIVWFQYRKKSP